MTMRANKYLLRTLVFGAGLYVVSYIVLALIRVNYPFELESMEGGSVDHCRRLLAGQNLYAAPTIEFVPFIYTPLYFYVSALVMKVVGVGFLAPRLVSFISSLGVIILINRIVWRETRKALPAFLAAALFAAAFRFSGAWYDVARVDSLYLLLSVGAVYAARRSGGFAGAAIAAVLLTLAVFTKQTALVMAPFLAACCLLSGRKQFVTFTAVLAVLTTTLVLLSNAKSGGWFYYYVVQLPSAHTIVKSQMMLFWSNFILQGAACALMIITAFFLTAVLGKNRWYYPLACSGLVFSSFVAGIHSGAYDNIIIPAMAGIAIMFGLAFSGMLEVVAPHPPVWRSLLLITAIFQFAALSYVPRYQLPTAEDRSAGEEFLAEIGKVEGEVFIVDHGFYPALVGKPTFALSIAVYDVLRAPDAEHNGYRPASKLMDEITGAITSQRFQAVILDGESWFPDVDLVKKYYPLEQNLFDVADAFSPVTGAVCRPELLFRREPARD